MNKVARPVRNSLEIKSMSRKLIAILLLTPLLQLSARADSVEPYITTGVIHESNLFLLTNDEEAQRVLNSSSLSDYRFEFSPGVKGELEVNRQRILFDFSVLRKNYDRFDSLDFTGGEARINWNWLYGRKWDGRVGYRFTKKQSNFNERLTEDGDSSDIHLVHASADRKLNSRYSLLSSIAYRSNEFKNRDELSIDNEQFELGLRFNSRSDNNIDLVYQYLDGEYTDRGEAELMRGLDTGYRDQSLLTRVYWQTSAKSLFEIEVGLTDRKQDTVSENDFDGLVGSINYEWAITDKTKLKSYIWRDLRDSEDRLTNFVEVDGIGIEAEWKTTAKITTFVNLGYENWDFQPNDGGGPTQGKKDDYTIAGIGVEYFIKNNISISSRYNYEKRDSNLRTRNFTNNVIDLILEITF